MQWLCRLTPLASALLLTLNSQARGQSCYNGYQQAYRPTYVTTHNYDYQQAYYPPYLGAYYQPVAVVGLFPLYTVTNNAIAVAPVSSAQTQLQAQQAVTQVNTSATTTAPVMPAWALTMKADHESSIAKVQADILATKKDVSDIKSMLAEAIRQSQGPSQPPDKIPDRDVGTTPSAGVNGYARCIQCHSQSGAVKSGSGLALMRDDGSRLPVSARVEKKVDEVIDSADPAVMMPPPNQPRLTAAEKKDIHDRQRTVQPAK